MGKQNKFLDELLHLASNPEVLVEARRAQEERKQQIFDTLHAQLQENPTEKLWVAQSNGMGDDVHEQVTCQRRSYISEHGLLDLVIAGCAVIPGQGTFRSDTHVSFYLQTPEAPNAGSRLFTIQNQGMLKAGVVADLEAASDLAELFLSLDVAVSPTTQIS